MPIRAPAGTQISCSFSPWLSESPAHITQRVTAVLCNEYQTQGVNKHPSRTQFPRKSRSLIILPPSASLLQSASRSQIQMTASSFSNPSTDIRELVRTKCAFCPLLGTPLRKMSRVENRQPAEQRTICTYFSYIPT